MSYPRLFLDPGKYMELERNLFQECLGIPGSCCDIHAYSVGIIIQFAGGPEDLPAGKTCRAVDA